MASRSQHYASRGGWTRPVVIYGLALLVIPLGVFCEFYYAFRGELGLAAIWMMIILCSIGVLGLYVRFVTLRHQLAGQTKVLDRLQRELDSIRQSADESVQQANRASVLPDVSLDLIAGHLEAAALMPTHVEDPPALKLVGGDEPTLAGGPPVAGVTEEQTPSFVPSIAHLRREFADHVRTENLADALATGMEIVAAFPQSAAAEEFGRLRPILLRRLGLTAGDSDSSLAEPTSDGTHEGRLAVEPQPPIMAL